MTNNLGGGFTCFSDIVPGSRCEKDINIATSSHYVDFQDVIQGWRMDDCFQVAKEYFVKLISRNL